jgi:hypothetical protein
MRTGVWIRTERLPFLSRHTPLMVLIKGRAHSRLAQRFVSGVGSQIPRAAAAALFLIRCSFAQLQLRTLGGQRRNRDAALDAGRISGTNSLSPPGERAR